METGVGPPSVAGVAAAMVTTTAQARGWPGRRCERCAAIDGARANREVDNWKGVGSTRLWNYMT